MKKLLIILVILLAIPFFILTNISLITPFLKSTLKSYGVEYNYIKGSLLRNIEVNGLSYKNQIELDIDIKFDVFSLINKSFHIYELNIDNLYIDKALLDSKSNNEDESNTDVYLETLLVDSLTLNSKVLKDFENIKASIDIKKILIDIQKLSVSAIANILIDSNFGHLNLNSTVVKNSYNGVISIEPKYPKLTIDNPIDISFNGDLETLKTDIKLLSDIKYDKELLKNVNLKLKSNFNLKSFDVKTDSNLSFAYGLDIAKLNLKTATNLNNIDETLKYSGVLKLFTDKNITINTAIDGDREQLKLISLPKGSIEGINIDKTEVKTNLNLNSLNLKSYIDLRVDSYIAKVIGDINLSLNLNDINKTLKYIAKAKAYDFKDDFKLFKENNIKASTVIVDNLLGDMKEAKASIILDKVTLLDNSTIESLKSDLSINIAKESLNIESLTLIATDKLAQIVATFYDSKISKSNQDVKFKAIITPNDTRLSEISIDGSLKDKNLILVGSSNELKLNLKSDDLDRFDIDLDSKLIAKEFNIDMIDLSLNGRYLISKEMLNSSIKIREFKSYNNTLSSDVFSFNMNKDDIHLSEANIKIKDKLLKLKLDYVDKNIDANIDSDNLTLKLDGRLEALKFDINIDSIERLQKDIYDFYRFKMLDIKGSFSASGEVEKLKYVKLNLDSKKISYEDITLSSININTNVDGNYIIFDNFDFHLNSMDVDEDFNLSRNAKVYIKDELIELKGFNFNDKIYIDGSFDKNLDLKVKTDGFKIAKDGYGRVEIDSISSIKTGDIIDIKSDIVIKNGRITYRLPKSTTIKSDRDIIFVDKNKKEEKQNSNLKLDISIKSADNLLYYSEDGKISLNLALNVKQELNNSIEILGDINLLKGFYVFEGKKFFVEPSYVKFLKSKEINPLLNLKLRYEEMDIIYIFISGLSDSPTITFSSEPYMSQKDILSVLLFGKKSSELTGGSSSSPNYSKAAMLFLSNSVSKDLAKSIGIDSIDISNSDSNEISVQVKKQLSDNLSINYKNSSSQNSIILEYDLNKNIGLESEISDKSNSFGIFYKKEF